METEFIAVIDGEIIRRGLSHRPSALEHDGDAGWRSSILNRNVFALGPYQRFVDFRLGRRVRENLALDDIQLSV